MSCFCCFQKGRGCQRHEEQELCFSCARRHKDRISLNPVKGLDQSEVKKHLDDLVHSLDPQFSFSMNHVGRINAFLHISTTTQHKFKNITNVRKARRKILVGGPFFPGNRTLRPHIDTFIWEHLSLQMKSKDSSSVWIWVASIVGGYLCLLFPLKETTPNDQAFPTGEKQNQARRHLAKFSILRIAELIDAFMNALRGLNEPFVPENDALDIIASAGVLYCEIEQIRQRYQNHDCQFLCDHSELEESMRDWLKVASEELFTRLEDTCGQYPVWSKSLEPPIKNVKRNFNILTIELTIEVPTMLKNRPKPAVESFPPFLRTPKRMLPPTVVLSPNRQNLLPLVMSDSGNLTLAPVSKGKAKELQGARIFSPTYPNTLPQSMPLGSPLYDFTGLLVDEGWDELVEENQDLTSYNAMDDNFLFITPSFSGGNGITMSPNLQVPRMLFSNLGEVEQQHHHHVSGPLPYQYGTREETSVDPASDPPLLACNYTYAT